MVKEAGPRQAMPKSTWPHLSLRAVILGPLPVSQAPHRLRPLPGQHGSRCCLRENSSCGQVSQQPRSLDEQGDGHVPLEKPALLPGGGLWSVQTRRPQDQPGECPRGTTQLAAD